MRSYASIMRIENLHLMTHHCGKFLLPFINSKTLFSFTSLSILARVLSSSGGASDPAFNDVVLLTDIDLKAKLLRE